MNDRAHIRNGIKIAEYNGEAHRAKFAGGGTVSPVVIGFEFGEDKIVPIERETVDNSSSSFTEQVQEEIVENDRLLIRTTINDLPLEDARTEVKKRIQAKFDEKVSAPLDVGGSLVRRDGKRFSQILGADLNPNPNRKRVIEGEPVATNAATISAIKNVIMANEDANGENAFDLATDANAASSLADLEAIDIDSGWQ